MNTKMWHTGLTGYPLSHSYSPQLHGAAFKALYMNGVYRLYPVPPMPEGERALRSILDQVRSAALDGLNVTIPHKQAVIPFLDQLMPLARAAGAVNTIFKKDGKLCGDNTDILGFQADLRRFAGEYCGPALVLGAGGSARAVVFALLQAGCKIYIAARRREQVEELVECQRPLLSPGQEIIPLSLDADSINGVCQECGLVVNTTPLGMYPVVDVTPMPEGVRLNERTMVYDLIFNPVETRLVREARQAGLKATTGLGMLVEQGCLSFKLWTGMLADRQAMMNALKTALEDVKRDA